MTWYRVQLTMSWNESHYFSSDRHHLYKVNLTTRLLTATIIIRLRMSVSPLDTQLLNANSKG